MLAAAHLQGLHFEDDPLTRQLLAPELSHLSRACATVYTDSYVRGIARLTERRRLLPDAPPPLSAKDCREPHFPP